MLLQDANNSVELDEIMKKTVRISSTVIRRCVLSAESGSASFIQGLDVFSCGITKV